MASRSQRTLEPTIGHFELPDARCTVCKDVFLKGVSARLDGTREQAKSLKRELDQSSLNFKSSTNLSNAVRSELRTHFPRIDEEGYLRYLKFKVGPRVSKEGDTVNKTQELYVRVTDPIFNMSCDCTEVDEGFTHPLFYHRRCFSKIEQDEGSLTCRKCKSVAQWKLSATSQASDTKEQPILTIQEAQIPHIESIISMSRLDGQHLVTFPCDCASGAPAESDRRYSYKTVIAEAEFASWVQTQLKQIDKTPDSDTLMHHKFSCVTCRQTYWLSKALRESLQTFFSKNLKAPESDDSTDDPLFTAFGTPEHREIAALRKAVSKDNHTEFHRHALHTLTDRSRGGYRERAEQMLRDAERDTELLNASIVTLEERSQLEREGDTTDGQLASSTPPEHLEQEGAAARQLPDVDQHSGTFVPQDGQESTDESTMIDRQPQRPKSPTLEDEMREALNLEEEDRVESDPSQDIGAGWDDDDFPIIAATEDGNDFEVVSDFEDSES